MRSLAILAALAACGRLEFARTNRDASVDTPPDQAHVPTAPVFVQTESSGNTGATVAALALPADVTAGNMILVAIDLVPGQSITLVQTADNQGNTYRTLGPFDGIDQVRHYLVYAIAGVSGPTKVTATVSSAPGLYFDFRLHEYAGTAADDPIQATASATGTSTAIDAARSGPVTTTEPNELIFGFVTYSGQGGAGTGFTMRSMFDGDLTEDRVAVTPGAYEAISTLESGSSWTATVAAIRGR